jgi:dTDP-4-dehydrorhamnose reductase
VKALLTGAEGQLGRALEHILETSFELKAVSRNECDLSDSASLVRLLERTRPDLIVNAAAYTDVDGAEMDRAAAFAVNAAAPAILADWATRNGCALIHYSTEYVYSGTGEEPWREEDPGGPINVYGESKLAGDQAVLASGAAALVLRTSWLYGARGRDFVAAILRQSRESEELRVVCDQMGAPTPAALLAEITGEILKRSRGDVAGLLRIHGGCVNATAEGVTSRYGFAEAIVEEARALGCALTVRRIMPVTSGEYPRKAKRPLNSRLSLARLAAAFGIRPPDWRHSLRSSLKTRLSCLDERLNN